MGSEDSLALVGREIDGCRLCGVVGEGGFAVVYEGKLGAEGQRVAFKCLKRPSGFSADQWVQFVDLFEEEGRLLKRLGQVQPGIVRVLRTGHCAVRGARHPYLMMEWLDGVPLDLALSRRLSSGGGPFDEAEALALGEQLLEVLATAHAGLPDESGDVRIVAHRDIKPDNLFLLDTPEGPRLKLIDFGIAKVRGEGVGRTPEQPGASTMFQAFSPMYAAPEQFSKSFGETGPWTDVYAVGLLLTELVTGRRALDGNDVGALFLSTTSAQRPSPRRRGASVSDAIEELCQRALTVSPLDRYRDASEMLAALRRLRGSVRPTSKRPQQPSAPRPLSTRSWPGVEAPTPQSLRKTPLVDVSPSQPPLPQVAQGRPLAHYALGAVALVVLAGAGVAFRTVDGGPAPPPSPTRPAVTATQSLLQTAAPGASSAPAASSARVALAAPSASAASPTRGDVVRVEGGTFTMGDPRGEPDERPAISVTVASFVVDRTEVTVEAYEACVRAGACTAPRTYASCNWGHPAKRSHPVNCVDASQAESFCKWAGKRLPTEQEWEFVARAGSENRPFPWGSDPPGKQLCWSSDLTCEVGALPEGRSREGVLDLAGNVSEWTSSPYCPYGQACKSDRRAVRGGSFSDDQPASVRASARTAVGASEHAIGLGFRCAGDG